MQHIGKVHPPLLGWKDVVAFAMISDEQLSHQVDFLIGRKLIFVLPLASYAHVKPLLSIPFDGDILNHTDGLAARSDPHQPIGPALDNHPALRRREPTVRFAIVVLSRDFHPLAPSRLSVWLSPLPQCGESLSGFDGAAGSVLSLPHVA